MKSRIGKIIAPAVLTLIPFAVLQRGGAQEYSDSEGTGIYGYTSIDYDPDTKVVTAYSETYSVGASSYYYFMAVHLESSGCSASAESKIESTVAAQCTFQGSPGNTYNAYGEHTVGFFVETDEGYADPDGLSLWPEYDIDDPWSFPFTSFGTEEYPGQPETEVGETYDAAITTIPAACGDQRDTIVAEYESYGTPYFPECDNFTQDTEDPVYTFELLNQGTYSWAILTDYFILDLHELAALNSFTNSSAYRNPAREYAVSVANGGTYHPGSRHQYGDAIDVKSTEATWGTYQTDGHQTGACVEPEEVQNSWAHTHLDWRKEATYGQTWSSCPHGW